MNSAAPVADEERQPLPDLLRGIAILGILLVNMFSFGLPGQAYVFPTTWGIRSDADTFAFLMVFCFALLKFFPLFSILFGAGLWLQVQRFEAKGLSPNLYLRRLLFLAVIGGLHGTLIWMGDILLPYAIAGTIVFFCRNFSVKVIGLLGAGVLATSILLGSALTSLAVLRTYDFSSASATIHNYVELADEARAHSQSILDRPLPDPVAAVLASSTEAGDALSAFVYRHGGFLDITALRSMDYLTILCSCFCYFGLEVTGYMLLGLWLVRLGVFREPQRFTTALRRTSTAGFLLGIPLSLIAGSMVLQDDYLLVIAGFLMLGIGAVPMVAAYFSLVARMSTSSTLLFVASPLTAAGRMAFTNYLMQSSFLTLYFYSYGLGHYGEYGYAQLLGLTTVVWCGQLLFSVLWLRFFRFGPMEWVWRCFTYGRLQPMRRRSLEVA